MSANLAADHAIDGAGGVGDFFDDGPRLCAAANWRGANCLECQGQQSVSGQDRGGLAKLLVAGRLPAAKVVVVEARGRSSWISEVSVNHLGWRRAGWSAAAMSEVNIRAVSRQRIGAYALAAGKKNAV